MLQAVKIRMWIKKAVLSITTESAPRSERAVRLINKILFCLGHIKFYEYQDLWASVQTACEKRGYRTCDVCWKGVVSEMSTVCRLSRALLYLCFSVKTMSKIFVRMTDPRIFRRIIIKIIYIKTSNFWRTINIG